MGFQFTPDQHTPKLDIPFFEDARADFAPYYSSAKSAVQAQLEISTELGKLGSQPIGFIPGLFGSGNAKRYGYEIRFLYGGVSGVICAAGLPLRRESPKKIEQVRVQALLNVRDWLKAAVTARVFNPGSDVLIPYLLVDGVRTIADYIADTGRLPRLNPPTNEIVEGETVY